MYETTETYSVVFSSPSTGTLVSNTGVVTITDDDTQPGIYMNP